MYFCINSFALSGLSVLPVSVETDISDGLPVMDLVGYLGSEVKEARERVRTALKNSGFSIPVKRITINVSPASIRKQGTAFDLPIALSMMVCMELIAPQCLEGCAVMGELSLNGDIQGINGVLPRVLKAREMGFKSCFVPLENAAEGGMVDGIDVYGVDSLTGMWAHFSKGAVIAPTKTDLDEILNDMAREKCEDFADIRGQPLIKRCMKISAAGLHNVLMIGPPGAGKTMSASRMAGILPPLTKDECLELTKIYSVAGMLPESGMILKRPVVSPHHTCTPQALAGGGNIPRPGAISLAHKAVLFLDELPEFKKEALEILRQPLEEKKVHIARANANYTYPADFLLIAAMNPCRCGYYPDMKRCSCTIKDVKNYLSRISGPLLDRIDLCIEVGEISYDELSGEGTPDFLTDGTRPMAEGNEEVIREESTEDILRDVMSARERQAFRFRNEGISVNSQMNPSMIMKYCQLGRRENLLLKEAFKRLGMSARAYHRTLKVARTIADLADSEKIDEKHLYEAISMKIPDKTYGNMGG